MDYENMKLLAIDTSTDYLSIAVMDDEKVLGRFHKEIGRNHSDLLIPTIDKVMKKSRIRLKDVGLFCIGIGPGSFTGLRIGVATVKGLAYSLKKPVVAVPTLDAIANNVRSFKGFICPVLDARKNKVYACIYRSDGENIKRISGYLLLSVDELKKKLKKKDIFFLGDGLALLKPAGIPVEKTLSEWQPRAEVIGHIGLENFKKRRFVKPEELEPLYLYSRECDVTGR
ncbi:MAG: tRNA (adenosine(37)-N6)-threonylcarbamoyltransferase complex dimerization subunit type 1 TsaB [Candidatus Omnitrophica bacterium]|nr:tRNA (adenosine(37)-N6)-threonylcarbamoyltransferase complex dimerization subunit type 1 TsaB [Candidatus Omnitrophota bacterium]